MAGPKSIPLVDQQAIDRAISEQTLATAEAQAAGADVVGKITGGRVDDELAARRQRHSAQGRWERRRNQR